MKKKIINIVSLDVPFPPDYGGMIDVFYRVKAFKELGCSIILHCFEYGRGEPKELMKYCDEVFYYKRKKSVLDVLKSSPFIVETRKSDKLLQNLLKNDYPILIEGLHCSWLLENKDIKKRITMVRTHNIEHEYYASLKEKASGFKKAFFGIEAKKLKKYEPILKNAKYILPIKEGDVAHFKKLNPNTLLLHGSMPELEASDGVDLKDYVLFHGNLSVPENEEAAIWLLENIIPKLESINFKMAGKNPSEKIIRLTSENNVDLIANPSSETMNKLIAEARIHALYTSQATGIKLKLLNTLQAMGKTVVNPKMVEGTDLDKYCVVADDVKSYIEAIQIHFFKPANTVQRREEVLEFVQKMNTKKNVEEVFGEIL